MAKNINIIFLTRSYYPNIGGVEKHIYKISRVLAKKGYKITIITENTIVGPVNQFDYKINGVKVIRIPVGRNNWFKKFRIWKWMWNNKELLFSSDIIHCHDVFYWYLPLSIINPMKDVFTTFHGYEGYPVKRKVIIYRKIFEYMSTRTICVGDFMRKWYHANPTKVIYGGVDLPKKKNISKKNSAIFIGRLDKHTGIDAYVEATELIRKKIPDFTLTVYGDGPFKKLIEGKDGIILKGFISNLDSQIQNYEYAFVSRYLSILEVFGSRRYVYAHYDNPIKRDYLEMTPYKDWISVFNSPEELSQEILSGSRNKKLIGKAYIWVRNQTWERVANDYLYLWNKVI